MLVKTMLEIWPKDLMLNALDPSKKGSFRYNNFSLEIERSPYYLRNETSFAK